MNAIIINIPFVLHCALVWSLLFYSQKSKVTPNKYLFRVNILNLFWSENVFIHSKVGTAFDLDFGLYVCWYFKLWF